MCYVSLTGSPPSNALLEEAVFHRSTEMLSIIKEPELVLWEGTTKVNAQYYGLHSNYPGFYVIDPAKVRDFVIPSLSKCKVFAANLLSETEL